MSRQASVAPTKGHASREKSSVQLLMNAPQDRGSPPKRSRVLTLSSWPSVEATGDEAGAWAVVSAPLLGWWLDAVIHS